jgi:SAM-dependent methyltransferase
MGSASVVTRKRNGIARSVRLAQLFRHEATDPDAFYTFLADDTVAHLESLASLQGAMAIDIGGGPGYTAEALRNAGACCAVVEYSGDELTLHGRTPIDAVQGDAQCLPFRTGSVDLVHSSNVIEHLVDWRAMLDEMVRVLRPATGIGYLSFGNWFSPWGGHETSPWHYISGDYAVRRYERHYGRPPKNKYGSSLFRLDLGPVLHWFEARSDVEVRWMAPRYYPDWMRWIVTVPGAREFLTWNVVIVFGRRHSSA